MDRDVLCGPIIMRARALLRTYIKCERVYQRPTLLLDDDLARRADIKQRFPEADNGIRLKS